MKSLIDYYSDSNSGGPAPLTEVRLGSEPALVLLFTADCQETKLHYVEDEVVHDYVKCPGAGCPMCYTAVDAVAYDLLPVFDVGSGSVRVLKIRDERRPTGLAAKLLPHLKDPKVADKVVLISRRRFEYSVEARPLGRDARRGEAEIKAFGEALAAGLQLDSAFKQLSARELAEVPKVAARLAAMGGWQPPATPAANDSIDEAGEAS